MAGLYLHSVPVQVWQRQGGAWASYFFNASVVNDVAKYDGSRVVTFSFGNSPTQQGYSPRINDILVPISNHAGVSMWGIRANQPYYYDGVNNIWSIRPSILFLTAFNENTMQFSDLFSLPEYDLIQAGTNNLQAIVQHAATAVWNRLIAGHPFLNETERAKVIPTMVTDVTVKYDEPTPVKLNEVSQQLVLARDWRTAGGTAYYPPAGGTGTATINWLGVETLDQYVIDLRKEDVLQIEVRSRDSADYPNYFVAYDGTGAMRGAYLDASGSVKYGESPANQSWSLRTRFEKVETLSSDAEVGQKAWQTLAASSLLNSSDISILLDMTNRYNVVYNVIAENTRTLPPLGENIVIYGFLDDVPIYVPAREYDFATGKLLIATNDDITLEAGH